MAGILNKHFFIHENDIEFECLKLIKAFEMEKGVKIEPPIPAMDIIEYLGYNFDFRSDGIYEDRSVLGGLKFKEKKVEINEYLTKENGRLHFTVAHEIGHEILHTPILIAQRAQTTLFNNSYDELDIICRIGAGRNQKDPIEWQADKFASYLLMPTEEIKQAFRKTNNTPINVIRAAKDGVFPLPVKYYTDSITEEVIANGHFTNVSKMAMTNRLIGMKLIQGVPFQKIEKVTYDYSEGSLQ